MQRKPRIGIVGTGGMADQHARRLNELSERCELVAGCDINREQLDAFCRKHRVPEAFTELTEMLDHAGLDAVINATPDRLHAPLSLQILERRLHLFCEKPLAECYADAARMRDAAAEAGVANMVDFIYRNMPAIQTARDLVQSGELGEPRHVEASYLQSWLAARYWGDWRSSPRWLWRLSAAHGSRGVLGDVGVHILDFASLPVGPITRVQCRAKSFAKAEGNRIGEFELDAHDSAVITAEFANGALGVIHTSRWATGYKNSLRLQVHGDRGAVRLDLDRAEGHVEVCLGEHIHEPIWERVECTPTPDIWERFLTAIETGSGGEPDFARGAEIQHVLDACFEAAASGAIVEIEAPW